MAGWEPPAPGTSASLTRTFSRADVDAFAALSGDHNPLHFDAEFARNSRVGRLIVHGGLTTGLFNAIVAQQLPGPGSVFLHQEWDYPAALGIDEEVTAVVEVIESRADKPITRLRCVARVADGTEVLRGESLVYTMQPTAD